MAAFREQIFRCGLFLSAVLCTMHYAGASEIFAPNELFVENGTQAKLPCTFKSTEVTGSMTSITWTYTEEGSGSAGVVILHFIGGKQYSGQLLRFKDRVTWAGDINNKDVSIKIDKITSKDSGTYSCSVVNPPDIISTPKQIKLQVVEKEHYAEALEIYAPDELLIENGTQAMLPCTFRSSEMAGSATAIMWMYSKEGSSAACTVIFYFFGGRQYPGPQPHFKHRVSWAGDIRLKDASIRIDKMSPEDNGNYSCTVISPPNSLSPSKQIQLRVVGKNTNRG